VVGAPVAVKQLPDPLHGPSLALGTIFPVPSCPECHFDYDAVEPSSVAPALVEIGDGFRKRLLSAAGEDSLRRRPAPDVWSALEYACHVRDVLLVQRDRLYLALVEDTPSFARMYRDERVVLGRYDREDPEVVAMQVSVAAGLISRAFGELDGPQWGRSLIYNWPTPMQMDVLWLGAHTFHEGRHHLGDFDAVVAGRAP
jgi:S-DNA-T family DNA segregation ATPase FtsK/SpoIIIE